MTQVDFISGHTWHGRKGAIENGFRYSIDYVVFDPETQPKTPALLARGRWGLFSLQDRDYGGPPKAGRGAPWAREVLAHYGVQADRLLLLTQPRLLGHVFNPVSFWLAYQGDALMAVIAEVTNTFGDRHSYMCQNPDGRAIAPDDHIKAQKLMHVSPFQPVSGGYTFRFDIRPDRIGIWIDYERPEGGVIATLVGPRAPVSNGALLWSALRRPFGARRVLGLIHWQALKLWWKGARYRTRPDAPKDDISGGAIHAKEAS